MAVKLRREGQGRRRPRGIVRSSTPPQLSRGVCVEAAGAKLEGSLEIPAGARGIVIFVSDMDFGRMDPRQRDLALGLNRRGLGTLLFDLVESGDDAKPASDVDLLTERLFGATKWASRQWGVEGLPIGYVGSGLGSAAALSAAALLGGKIGAVATRSGRPDLAVADLGKVWAPTLLVADPDDPCMVAGIRGVAGQLHCAHRLCEVGAQDGPRGTWAAAPGICRWMEWHLGSPEVPYEPRLALG